jgi:hypothetical protein
MYFPTQPEVDRQRTRRLEIVLQEIAAIGAPYAEILRKARISRSPPRLTENSRTNSLTQLASQAAPSLS